MNEHRFDVFHHIGCTTIVEYNVIIYEIRLYYNKIYERDFRFIRLNKTYSNKSYIRLLLTRVHSVLEYEYNI